TRGDDDVDGGGHARTVPAGDDQFRRDQGGRHSRAVAGGDCHRDRIPVPGSRLALRAERNHRPPAHRRAHRPACEACMNTRALSRVTLWMQGLIFTALVPLVVAGWMPSAVDPLRRVAGGAASAGWLLIAGGAAIYGACLTRFLASGGTPAIFFTRPVRAVI